MYSDVYLDLNDFMGTDNIYGSFSSLSSYQRDSKMLMIGCIISVVILLWTFICLWCIYKKLGLKGWAVLVPFYGPFVLYRRILGSGWLFLLSVLPGVNLIVMFLLYSKMAKIFGKGILFGISLIFLTPITYPILAFGKAMPVDNVNDLYNMDEEQPAEFSIVEEPAEKPKKRKASKETSDEKPKKRKAPKEAPVEEPIEEISYEEPAQEILEEEPVQEVYTEPSVEELIAVRKLNKLDELLAEGFITKAQYNRKKREIESSLK